MSLDDLDPRLVRVADTRHGRMAFPAADHYLSDALGLCGEYCRGEALLYERLVPPGGVVLDVGANIGIFAVQFGRLAGADGAVFAFEVQAGLHRLLTENVAANGLADVVRPLRIAVGDTDGALKMVSPRLVEAREDAALNYGGFSLLSAPGGEEVVPLRRIDTLAGDLGFKRLDLIKIDVEGFETRVVEGALATIEAHRPVLSIEADRGEDGFRWMDALFALGYRMVRVSTFILSSPNYSNHPIAGLNNANCINVYCFPGEIPGYLRTDWALGFSSREEFLELHTRRTRTG